jgi:hypothetical protein
MLGCSAFSAKDPEVPLAIASTIRVRERMTFLDSPKRGMARCKQEKEILTNANGKSSSTTCMMS